MRALGTAKIATIGLALSLAGCSQVPPGATLIYG